MVALPGQQSLGFCETVETLGGKGVLLNLLGIACAPLSTPPPPGGHFLGRPASTVGALLWKSRAWCS